MPNLLKIWQHRQKKKKHLGINVLPIKTGMETSENTTSKKLEWIMGDVTKFDFNEELVDVDESNNRLIQFFLVTASFLLIAANILTIQYSFKGLKYDSSLDAVDQ